MQTDKPVPTGETPESVTRQIDVGAPAERVWESLGSNEGRERWLEPDPSRVIVIEREEPCRRIAWWWFSDSQAAHHVDIRVIAIPTGTRVIVTESAPQSFPLAAMAAAAAGRVLEAA